VWPIPVLSTQPTRSLTYEIQYALAAVADQGVPELLHLPASVLSLRSFAHPSPVHPTLGQPAWSGQPNFRAEPGTSADHSGEVCVNTDGDYQVSTLDFPTDLLDYYAFPCKEKVVGSSPTPGSGWSRLR